MTGIELRMDIRGQLGFIVECARAMDREYDVVREAMKWLALITMTIDHVGAILYPRLEGLRIIGRLSFPLFCYLLILGLETTRSVENYYIRLFIFALLSQVPYYLAFGLQPFDTLNIFFTLSSGLAFIHFYQKKRMLFTIFPVLASGILNFDYSIYGIILIFCMYLIRKDPELGTISMLLLNLLSMFVWPLQFYSLLALPLILLHNGGYLRVTRNSKGKGAPPGWRKYLFYAYYPLHLSALYLLRLYL